MPTLCRLWSPQNEDPFKSGPLTHTIQNWMQETNETVDTPDNNNQLHWIDDEEYGMCYSLLHFLGIF